MINHWYRALPDPDGRFADRLRSENNVDHVQAIDELLAHQLLKTRCDNVRYEEGGAGPDFRVYREGHLIGAVEVRSLFEPGAWSAGLQRVDRLIDALNVRLGPADRWFIGIVGDLDDFPTVEIPLRPCAAFLRAELARLPMNWSDATDDFPAATFRFAGRVIEFRFTPRTSEPMANSSDHRIVGHGPTVGGMINVSGRLKSKRRPEAGEPL